MLVADYRISIADVVFIFILFMMATDIIYRLSDISVNLKGFSARFVKIEQNVHLILEALRRILTKYEYQQLLRLTNEEVATCRYSSFLLNEMIRLCQHGFARERFERSTWSMKERYENTPRRVRPEAFL
jgi:hypothetical protein